mgnify:CR=1 FL=1
MSLIITGNKLTQSGVKDIGIAQSPYHYRNSLKETITLPKDCEVAVQSVKLNKGEAIHISPDDGFYGNFSLDIAKLNDGRTTQNTTSMPVWGSIGLTDAGRGEDVSLIQFQTRLSEALKSAFPPPNIANLESSVLSGSFYPLSDRQYNATTGAFEGFDLTIKQTNSSEDVEIAGDITTFQKWWDDAVTSLTWTKATKTISSSASAPDFHHAITDMNGVLTDFPISLNTGNMRIDITDDMVTDTTDWEVVKGFSAGLCRDQKHGQGGEQPSEYFTVDGHLPADKTFNNGWNEVFMDFGIYVIQDPTDDNYYLHLGQSSVKETDIAKTCMNEIKYYGWTAPYPGADPPYATRYNLSTNTDKHNQYLIRTLNEVVEIYYHTGALSTSDNPLDDSGWTLLSSRTFSFYYDSATAYNYKLNYPKPIAQTCWWMYPKFVLPVVSSSLVLSAYSGMKRDGLVKPYNKSKYSWNARMSDGNHTSNEQLYDVDSRYMNQMFNTTLYTYSGVGTDQMKDFVFTIILYQDEKFYIPTDKATDEYMSRKLGYGDIHLLRPDINGVALGGGAPILNGWSYEPVSSPAILNSGSLFIRLDNLTQKTINGAVGRPSKILYTLPQQDQRGGSTGILYYEPHDRVYVSLGNPEPLTINTFDLSICDENEILVKTLQDQTIICLHFRDRPHIN